MIDAQRVDFVAIPVTDKDRAVAFYEGTLGLERDPNSTPDWPEFSLGNVTLALEFPQRLGRPLETTPFGAIAIRVPDVAAARTKLEEAGVAFEGDTFDSGVCHMAYFRDPDGNGLMLHRRYAPFAGGSQP